MTGPVPPPGAVRKETSMSIQEITLEKLNPASFIDDQVRAIREAVGDGLAINALSGASIRRL